MCAEEVFNERDGASTFVEDMDENGEGHPSSSLDVDSAFFEAILAALDAAVIATDLDGRIQYVNSFARDLIGEGALRPGGPVEDLVNVETQEAEFLLDAMEKGIPYEANFSAKVLASSKSLRVRSRPLVEDDEQRGNMLLIAPASGPSSGEFERARRSSLERILVDLSHFFVSNDEFDVPRLLGRVGKAIDADHVYLITAPPDDAEDAQHAQLLRKAHDLIGDGEEASGWPVHKDAYEYRDWWRTAELEQQEAEEQDDHPVAYAVPILSARDKLYGYLGLEFIDTVPDWLDDSSRLLDVLGDMLSAYLERQFAERALRASEERYRLFVTAISEGIWCLEPESAVDTTQPPEDQLAELRETLLITECNQTMADLLEAGGRDELIGKKLSEVLADRFDDRFLYDFINGGYVLHSQEYEFTKEGRDHHFVANAVGTHSGDHLTSIWGSWTDVTDRVELERRMVTALEMQQQRIGHELHDGVGQLITGVSMLSQNLAERHFEEGAPGYEQAMKIVRFTRESQQLLRELQRGLAPVQVQGRSLAQSLEELTRNIDDLPGVHCMFHHDGGIDTNADELKLQLYRIAQEAINNALKHADPNHIYINFRRQESRVLLEISDDGKGFDIEAVDGESLGLVSLQYRAKALNATIDIDSEPGEGTIVRCSMNADDFEGGS